MARPVIPIIPYPNGTVLGWHAFQAFHAWLPSLSPFGTKTARPTTPLTVNRQPPTANCLTANSPLIQLRELLELLTSSTPQPIQLFRRETPAPITNGLARYIHPGLAS
jgi:hypothetical protein